MSKAPSFPFYPDDFLRDMLEHSLEIRGAWITILNKLHSAERRGILNLNLSEWSRIFGENEEKTNEILLKLNEKKVGDFKFSNGNITVISRRMVREEKAKENNRLRQKRHYKKEKPNTNLTEKYTAPSFSSSSSLKDLINNKLCVEGEVSNNNIQEQKISPAGYKKLIKDYPEKTVEYYIEKVKHQEKIKGKKYPDFEGTVRLWMLQDGISKVEKRPESLKDKEINIQKQLIPLANILQKAGMSADDINDFKFNTHEEYVEETEDCLITNWNLKKVSAENKAFIEKIEKITGKKIKSWKDGRENLNKGETDAKRNEYPGKTPADN